MKPPIASPHEESRPVVLITRRIEWDEKRECFVFRYTSPFWGRLRCEIHTGLRTPTFFFAVTLFMPITALVLAVTHLAEKTGCPKESRVFAWGIEGDASEMTIKCNWKNIKKTRIYRGDLFVWRRAFLMPSGYLCRENFADEAESQRLLQIIQLLQSQNGANWEAVKHQFQSEEGGLL